MHVPDESTPISETMEGIKELYLAGKFDQFGISNFSAEQVEECYNYAKSKSYVLPTIYQSVYRVISRANENTLFPTLRRLNISIQAYSALASGFLVRTPDDIAAGKGNFDPSTVLGKILHEMYCKLSYLEYLKEYNVLAKEAGSKQAGLAYRWIAWHSELDAEKGDAMVLGASGANQLEEIIGEINKGPLEVWVVERLERMWKFIEKDAPGDNFGTFKKLTKLWLL